MVEIRKQHIFLPVIKKEGDMGVEVRRRRRVTWARRLQRPLVLTAPIMSLDTVGLFIFN